MTKLFISLLIGTTILWAQPFKVNDALSTFSLPNQFDKKQTITPEMKLLLVSFEKGTGADVNAFLAQKPSDFLAEKKAAFIADISGMPMIITKMFALPKMRDYPHNVLLIYDDNDDRFVHEDGKSTLYRIEQGTIKSIEFITQEDLPKVFE